MRYCAIVDAFSTGQYLAAELKKYDIACIHVQSQVQIAEYFVHSFHPDDFIENIIHEDLKTTSEKLRQYSGLEFVITGSEVGVELADAISENMGLLTNGTEQSDARRNKFLMSERLRTLGIRAVKQIATNSVEEIRAWQKDQGLDEIVVKPVDSAGTDNVFFCRNDRDIDTAFKSIHNKVNLMGKSNDTVLAQERLRGEQATVNAVSIDGKHYFSEFWTDKRREVSEGSVAYELEELLPGDFNGRKVQEDYMRDVLDALEISHGPTHSELMLTNDGPVLIEVGARLQGGFAPNIIVEGLGYNHVTLTAQCYAEPESFKSFVEANEPYKVKKFVRAVSLISEEEGFIEAYNKQGLDGVKALPTFGDFAELLEVGEQLHRTVDLATTPAVFYLAHEDVDLLEKDFQHLRSLPMSELFQLAR